MEKDKLGTVLCSRLDLPVKVKPQPWYRERIDSKYARNSTDTSRWTFIKDGLDDYRDGKPPRLDDTIVIKGNKGMIPNLTRVTKKQPRQRITKSLDPHDIFYSKLLPNQRRRVERVKELELNVLNESLANLPGRNDLSPMLIKDVQGILSLPVSECSTPIHHADVPDKYSDSISSSVKDCILEMNEEETRRMYSLYKKQSTISDSSEEQLNEDSQTNDTSSKPSSGELEQVEVVTKEFCDWVKDIGGESNNIEEETINELFVCAYEGDPSTANVQTMNLSKVPSELLADAQISRHTCIKRNIASRGSTYSNGDKIKYGAWYLSPKTWKPRPANVLLRDEKKNDGNTKPEDKHNDIDQLLPSLHSAQTFLNFSQEKNFPRIPELLRNVRAVNELVTKTERDDSLPDISNL